jgi:hypothetical protein
MDQNGTIIGTWARGHLPPVKIIIDKNKSSFCNPWELTRLVSPDKKFRFSYPKVDDPKDIISDDSPELQGIPYLLGLSIFSCPNSQDHISMSSRLCKEYLEKGLKVIFVIMKMPDDISLIRKRCDRLVEEYDFTATFAFSRALNKEKIAQDLPDIEKFYSWPTTIFVGSNGQVNAIHAGMDGPGTGVFHKQLVQKYRTVIERMISSK